MSETEIEQLVANYQNTARGLAIANEQINLLQKDIRDLQEKNGNLLSLTQNLSLSVHDLAEKNAVIQKDRYTAWDRVKELEETNAKLGVEMVKLAPYPPPKPYDMDTWEYGYGGKVMRVFTPSELDPVLYGAIQRYVTHVLSPYQRPEVKPRGVGMADPKGTVQP